MAAASIPSTSGIKQTLSKNKDDEKIRPPTVEELLIQIENHLYKSPEHRASLLIAVWSCLGGGIGCFRNIDKVFQLLYRESAMMIFNGYWPKMNILFKRGLARAVIQYSHTMGMHVKGSEGLCSALVLAVYDPWGDPILRKLLNQEDIDQTIVKEFVKSEPHELLLIRVECLVKAHYEEAAIGLLQCCLHSISSFSIEDENGNEENWRWSFMEWLLRLLFRKRRLNDIVAESSSCSCHDGVRLIHQTLYSKMEDSEPLTETLINLFLVRDLLFQSNYCCTSELMKLWCEFQAKKQKSASEIQEAARKLLVGHASSSAQFYLFVDILWGKFGISLLPLYLEMYVRGLTSDLNFLEAARQADNKEYVIEIENHMAAMYFKLSSLFSAINKEIALECLLSAFSLDPTKERLEWIKKLSLQVSKEKALKAAMSKDDPKHKLCNRSGYPHCTHPGSVKRKAVVMCDQAIQVGDDSFAEFETPQPGVMNNLNSIDHESCDITKIVDSRQMPEPMITNEKGDNSDDVRDVNLSISAAEDEAVENGTILNDQTLAKDDSLLDAESKKNSVDHENEVKSVCFVNDDKIEVLNKNDTETKNVNHINSEILDVVVNCSDRKDDAISTSLSGHNHISEKSESAVNNGINLTIDKLALHCKTDRINHLSVPTVCQTLTEQISTLDKSVDNLKKIRQDDNIDDSNLNEHNDFLKKPPDILLNDKAVVNHHNTTENENTTNICVNGNEEMEHAVIQDNKSELKVTEEQNIEREKISEQKGELTNSEKIEPTSLIASTVSVNDNDNKTTVSHQEESDILPNPQTSTNLLVENPKVINELNVKLNQIEPRVTRRSEAMKNENLYSFSHIVMDSKMPGISPEILSDFVIALESLRNKQLKSSCKWSQIKHLCEHYLESVTNLRCMMLNMQLNGSVDSEADSTSEFTGNNFKEFEFHQSNDSVVEDHYTDKTHVFKRFMNSDKVGDMATYVNLSDIHCPQIPLEKLFYTDHSSSHAGHKKKHKKHRNHDKNPGKLVLKKFRHGSRAERELMKRKKRKKRKAKKGKGHTKKHRFTHGKVTKEYLKNKKKKHKLKKKKDGNSGFISGDYCSDFSSEELMRLVKEHSNSYSKMPAATSKHPLTSALVVRSASSSDFSDEPQRKKRKVSFSKKRGRNEKHHDKHKHVKSKSSKRKKTIVMESCGAGLKNVIKDNSIGGNLDSVKDYSRIVQYSSVKKMEAVQIRQSSMALNLSKVNKKLDNQMPSVNPCEPNPQLQQFVHQNFESYSPEDIMKMQLLMSRQQQPCVSAISNTLSTANNQAVLKYVCSKTTSRLLSVAQSSNCVVASDSETSKSPIPTFSSRTSNVQKLPTVLQQPQNLTSNVKHYFIDANKNPYKLSNTSSAVTGSALIPVSHAGNSLTDAHNLPATVHKSSSNYSTTVTSPQVATFTFPVANNPLGGRLIGNKIVIPLPPCGHIRTTSTAGMALVPAVTTTYATLSGNQPSSNVIIFKNGNSTQIIQNPQQPSSTRPIFSNTKTLPLARNKPLNPVVTKTVPKMIKQAAKKLSQPVVKRSLIKIPLPAKSAANGPSDLTAIKKSVSDSGCRSSPVIDCTLKLDANNSKTDPSPESLLVQRAIEEAKRAIAESAPERPTEQKRSSKSKKENVAEKKVLVTYSKLEQNAINIPSANEEPLIPESSNSPQTIDSNSAENNIKSTEFDIPPSPKVTDMANIPSPIVETPMSPKEISEGKSDKTDLSIETEDMLNAKSEAVSISAEVEPNATDLELEPKQSGLASLEVVENNKSNFNTDDKPSSVEPSNVESPSLEKEEICASSPDASIAEEESFIVAEENKPETFKDSDVSAACPSVPEISICPNTTKAVTVIPDKQQKELQPINEENGSQSSKMPGKVESGVSVSEVPTRSFTSISDAVRFSLMDMDDATDSVENQVLQAFQVSHESAPNSPAYDNNSSNDGDTSVASPTAVILTTPQNTSTTELNVSRVSQRFETSIHGSQTEKFTECESTVSRTTTWILEDSPLNETSQALGVRKSPDIDSSGEAKDEERPKKKKKRRDRCERDLESAHKFWCEICHKGFFSAYNLRRHCRNVHKMNLPRGSSDLPFGPKGACTSELSFVNNSQCHQQGESSSSEVVTPPRLPYVQQSCVSPKGAEFLLQSPTHENKNQDFSMKVSTSQHSSQMQSSDFQMQTPPRMSSQSSSTHVSPVTPTKDFRLPTSTTASPNQLSPNKLSSVSKSTTSPKFQRLPTSCSTPKVPQVAQVSQISLCGQPAVQQMQLGQLQSSALIQPLSNVACQAQQMQAAQCAHFQANKQIIQQSIGQLQLMHHSGQMPAVQHTSHVIPKQTQVQQFKKCSTTQQTSKMTETEQIQQAAQLAQTQQILANQHLQKLMHIRQNAIVASGATSQLSLGAAVSGMQGSPSKSTAQCFQVQLAAARQAAAAAQLPTQQRSQGTSYNLASHNSTGHQFFPPSVQPNQEQSNCPHSFTAQNVVEFNSTGPSYPTIRLSSETNDGLEDLEQFLLENMPWSGDQSVSHGLAQQSGNRPSSADSLTLAIPSSSSQSRAGTQQKNKSSISRPKPRKPTVASCSKNLLGNLGRGVKKKSSPKKLSKNTDSDGTGPKSDIFSQTGLLSHQTHGLDLMQRQCNKGTSSELLSSKSALKNTNISSVNETDSSDSVQCINVTHNPHSKNLSVGINFCTFPTAEKNMNICHTDQNNTLSFDAQGKHSFLDQCSLMNKTCSNLGDNKTNAGLNNTGSLHAGSPFALPSKDSMCDSKTSFCRNAGLSLCPKRSETSQEVFLGQRNTEECDSVTNVQINTTFDLQDSANIHCTPTLNMCHAGDSSSALESRKSSVVDLQNNLFLGGKTASTNDCAVSVKGHNVSVSVKADNCEVNLKTNNDFLNKETVNNATRTEAVDSELCLKTDKVTVRAKCSEDASISKIEKGVVFTEVDDNPVTKKMANYAVNKNTKLESGTTDNYDSIKQIDRSEISISNSINGNAELNEKYINTVITDATKSKDINFNDVSFKDDILNNPIPISESNNPVPISESNNPVPISESNKPVPISESNKPRKSENIELSKESDYKTLFPSNNVIKPNAEITNSEILDGEISSKIEENLENVIDQLVTRSVDKAAKSDDFNNCDKESFMPNYDVQDKPSSQEIKVLNGVNYVSDAKYCVENVQEQGTKHIALRIHKSQDVANENDKNVKYYVSEKPLDDIKVGKKKSHKKKTSHTKKCEVIDYGNGKTSPLKLDINSNVQKNRLSDANKKNDENEGHCIVLPCFQDDSNQILEETQENDAKLTTPEKISPGRLRLRDTPKTSVKRVCPCCVDSRVPKRCRTNIIKIFGPKAQNNSKGKTTLKVKNSQNTKSAKVNTRSSQRLRSRNNAIS